MSYRIEITADTVAELAGKLLAAAAQFQPAPAHPLVAEAEERIERIVNTSEGKAPEPILSQPEDIIAHTVTSDTPEPAAAETRDISLSEDITPRVMKLVAVKGKPAAEALLAQYGVARASQIDPALWGDLIDNLDAEIAG